MPRTDTNFEAKIADATLREAAQKGWNAVTLDLISREAKLSPSRVHGQFRDKNAILPVIVKIIDQRSMKALSKLDKRSTPRDRLFEAFMARFDVLQRHRQGIIAIIEDGLRNPAIGRHLVPAHCQSLRQILTWSGISVPEREKTLIITALMVIYYRTIWCWKKDSSSDMGRTMAALDQALRIANNAAELLFRSR